MRGISIRSWARYARETPSVSACQWTAQPPNLAHGLDVDDSGRGVVTEQRLHQLIRQPGAIADRTFEIEFLDSGVEAFAFTFG